ncbi:MAG TPA: amidohydrolase family protein [Galbitalea sp.]
MSVAPPGYAGSRIDAHLHVWHRTKSEYAWLSPGDELDADFPPHDAAAALRDAGFSSAVLVQADDTASDTRYLLDVAGWNEWVAGVVGWVPLSDPEGTAAELERLSAYPVLRGVRQLIHVDPDPHFLERPTVRASLAAVAKRGLAFDVPDAWPAHLQAVPALAVALPHLKIVLDHLGRPPVVADDVDVWRSVLTEIASRPNVVVKFSGLAAASSIPPGLSLADLWNIALDTFGASRIMYGGDWPISRKAGTYREVWNSVEPLIATLSPAEQAEVMCGTASRTYRLRTSVAQ